MCHVADKFYAAVRTLATDAPLKQRLISAYVDHLEALAEEDVPEAIQTRFVALRQAMNAVPPTEKETAVQVSVRKMSQAEAARFTRSILVMFAEQIRVRSTGERLDAGEGIKSGGFNRLATGIRVPSFLAR
jgi:hypothetical protein